MEVIITILIVIVGIAIGTSLSLYITLTIQIILFIWGFMVKREGMSSIIPTIISGVLIISIFLGDLSYVIQTDMMDNISIPNPFIVNSK